tara:strand:- start:195 stop:335 length:141 start_codon:yes stop_codon:yes gene_type:complete
LLKKLDEEKRRIVFSSTQFIIDLLAAFSSKEKERQKNDSARSFIAG